MIVKHRTPPLRLLMDEALERRLPDFHPKKAAVREDIAKRRAGFQGEQLLDYQLEFLHYKDNKIFQDLRLQVGDKFFQIDNLIIFPHFILIIEVKNIAGTIYFDPLFNQLVRTINGKEEAFQDPLIQVQRQKYQLESWLEQNKFDPIDIEYLIAISQPSTHIKAPPNYRQAVQKVCHVENVMNKIGILIKSHNQKTPIHEKKIKKLSRLLQKYNTAQTIDICDQYGIDKSEIIPGVMCPKCGSFQMRKKPKAWVCEDCKNISVDAYTQAFYDYFLLIHPTINNKQCREFLKLSSEDTTRRLLQSMDLPYTGSTRNRVYHHPPYPQFYEKFKPFN